MGVKELWPLLESAKQNKHFDELRGETVAVDLSMWIVDSQCVKQMAGAVTRPHLRNLFFRTSALLQADILPVFVVDGVAPELKWQTMADRQQLRQGMTTKRVGTARQANRSHFKSVVKECCEMLDLLGVQYIESEGEAEAMCATLNSLQMVDAVITEDGDAFLYGAHTIYKNFTTTKVPSVDSYSMRNIQSSTQLTRSHLIALALLVGCDYCPKGVPGIGVTQALKFCKETPGDDILKRLLQWAQTSSPETHTPLERTIATKISKMKSQEFSKIIEEFLNNSKRRPPSITKWKRPLVAKSQELYLAKLEWPINYGLEKLLPLLTLWSFNCVTKDGVPSSQLTIRPHQILKKRVRKGVECYEVLWSITDLYKIDEADDKPASLVTIENADVVEQCFPLEVEQFLQSKAKKKGTKATRSRAKAEALTEPQLHAEGINQTTERLSLTDNECCDENSSPVTHSTHPLPVSHAANTAVSQPKQHCHHISLSDDSLESLPVFSICETKYDAAPSSHSCLNDSQSNNLKGAVPTLELSVSPLSLSDEINQSKHTYRLSEPSASPPILSAPEPKGPRSSIDRLLADISDHIKTPQASLIPKSNKEVKDGAAINLFSTDDDCIITGHLTPSHCVLTSKTELSSTAADLHGYSNTSTVSLNESSISLFNLESSVDVSPLACLSGKNSLDDTQQHHQTADSELTDCLSYGNFDIVPEFSAFSLTE